MMYKCEHCGAVFEEPTIIRDPQGINYGFYDEDACCPACRYSSFHALERCERCGDYYEETFGGCCEDCIEDETTLENCLQYGEMEKEEIEINGLLLQFFSVSEIEEILTKQLDVISAGEIEKTLKSYVKCYKDDFGEWIRG